MPTKKAAAKKSTKKSNKRIQDDADVKDPRPITTDEANQADRSEGLRDGELESEEDEDA